ncbi:hypothetical protein M569_09190 [Genlisea aurea]|uniref:RRM domain-containing protein n=1 Tax=Genlisea aurea TaxID=192259 RepID=S8DR59_9LAMI|nr:hypothetical protein M569_09190 [Genlisea aurea]
MAKKRKSRGVSRPTEVESVQSEELELVPEDFQSPNPKAGADLELDPDSSAPTEEPKEALHEEDLCVVGEQGDEDSIQEAGEADEEEIPENIEDYNDGDARRIEETGKAEGILENPSEKPSSKNDLGGQNEESEGGELEEEPLEKLLEPFSKEQLTLLIKAAVVKHPDVMENVHSLADSDPAHCKIFVHGLGWDANAESITSVFSKYGEIEDCKVVKDKNSGKSKGYGFILYKHRLGARRALKEPQKLIEGRMTSCQLASAGPVQTPPPSAVAAAASSPSVSEYTQRKIYVSNVSADLDPNKLYEFFSKFGEIEEGPLGLDKQSGRPRGFCLFVYKTVESAKKSLEEPHKTLDGHLLHCQKAIDGPKHSKGHFNPQHGQSQQQQQHHHHLGGHQGYHHSAKKGRYAGSSGAGHTSGHVMAPNAGPQVPPMGFNPAVAPAALGQAVAAILATQGAGLGIGNLLGGIGAGPQVPPMMNANAYGSQGGSGYGGQGGYGGQPQIGPGGVRPHQGGYMGHGH